MQAMAWLPPQGQDRWPKVRLWCDGALTTEPHPGVDEPEGHGDRIHDLLTLDPLLVLILQQL